METPTDRKAFQLGYWIAAHKPQLRIAHRLFWIGVNSIIWIIFLWHAVNWVTHIQQTTDIWRNISIDIVNWASRRAPQDIVVQKIDTVRYNEKSVDIMVTLYNPNDIWAASIPYTLSMNGSALEEGVIELAPEQTRYITQLRVPFSGDGLPNVRAVLGDPVWKKMADAADILPTQQWAFERASFHEISGDAAEAFRTELSFDLVNQSVFGFRQVEAILAMIDAQGAVTALNSVVVDTITTKEARQVVLRWPKDISRTHTPKLFIDLNLLDETKIIRTLE